MENDAYHIYRVRRITRVVDGDTIDCEVDAGFCITVTERFRLLDVDAPEVRGPEKIAGKAVTAVLKDELAKAVEIRVHSRKKGNFRRWLGIFEYRVEQGGEWLNLNTFVEQESIKAEAKYLSPKQD